MSEEPLLALPNDFLKLLSGVVPAWPRPLQSPKPQKRESWLKLARALLAKGNSEITERSVAYLLLLCTRLDFSALPPLPWHSLAVDCRPHVHVDFDTADKKILSRMLPAMLFRASIQRVV
eukprot:s6649_g2.t1